MPYLLKTGKWRAERQIDGKRHTKTCNTKREAQNWEAAIATSKTEQETQEGTGWTVLEWLNAYLDFASERHGTVVMRQKKRCAKNLLETVPQNTPASSITPLIALDVIRSVASRRCNGAANTARKELGTAWEWGRKYHGFQSMNPFRILDPLPQDQHPRRVPTMEEFHTVCNLAQPRDRRFLLACLHTAARKSELFRLRWSECDFERGYVLLGTRKRKGGGMEYDPVPMTSTLRSILIEQRREGASEDLVFCQPDGTPYTTRERLLSRICERAGILRFSLHGIRHLTASMLAQEGVPLLKIQAILRHKRLATTERYIAHISPLENVLESVLSNEKWPSRLEAQEPHFNKVPHAGPQSEAASVKIQ